MAATARDCNDPIEVLYLAFELGERSWKLAFTVGRAQKPRIRSVPARDVASVGREIELARKRFGVSADAPVISCYEAGRDGFWLHRALDSNQITNLVVDSSSIEVNRRSRRAKTDRLDAAKLVIMLVRWSEGERKVWSVVSVPSDDEEDARQLHRELETLRRARTSHINRLAALLVTQGLSMRSLSNISELEKLRRWDGTAIPAAMRARYHREFVRLQLVERQIEELEQERVRQIRQEDTEQNRKVRKLLRVRGIGLNSSCLFVREVFGWRRVKNRRQLGSICGLVPTPYNSGGGEREQGISKAGNRRMRAMAVEIAWLWLQYQPTSELSRWYKSRFGGGSGRMRRIGIVALARKLVIALWRYLEYDEVPRGAVLGDWETKLRTRRCRRDAA